MDSQQSGFQLAQYNLDFSDLSKESYRTNAQRAKEKTAEHKARMNWVYLHWFYLLSFPEVWHGWSASLAEWDNVTSLH